MKGDLCLISVDIETTGPTPGHYSMYELGACAITTDATFERKIALLPNSKFSSASLKAVRMTKRKLLARKQVTEAKRAMLDFANWSEDIAKGARLVFVANNAPFDWMFIAWYFEEFRIANPYGYSALDMKAYYMGMSHTSWDKATLKEMSKHCGWLPATLPHQALQDALIQKEIFSALVSMNSQHPTKCG